MKSLILSTLLSILTIHVLFSQTMPSPASQGVISSQNGNAGLFSGSTTIGVPLFAATANNGASVPVSLSYSTSGIKVAQTSTPVGLGWNLNAGGMITRVIRGVPDEYAPMIDNPSNLDYGKLNMLINGSLDGEKDLFYLSFPGGGGRFIFEGNFNDYLMESVYCHPEGYESVSECQSECDVEDPNCMEACHSYYTDRISCQYGIASWSNFQMMPYSDIKITYINNEFPNGYWEVTDLNGVKYLFDINEETKLNKRKTTELYDPSNEYTYISTWHLSKITYPDLPDNKSITFSYTNPIPLEETALEYETIGTALSTGGNISTTDTKVYESRKETGVRYIKGIHFTKGDIEFIYSNARDDLPGSKRLELIELNDKFGNTVSSYSLDQEYFYSKDSYLQGGRNAFCSGPECKRLKLNAIYKDGSLVRGFTYINEDYSSGQLNYYELPPRNSFYTDHWGYNNAGDHQGNTYVPNAQLEDEWVYERSPNRYSMEGIDKRPSEYAKANILTSVIYPTGGTSKYTYGHHRDAQGTIIGAGLRVESIQTFDENENLIRSQSFTYEQLNGYNNPSYLLLDEKDIGNNRDRFIIYNQSISNVLQLNNMSIGYGKVSITNDLIGSKEVHYFKNAISSNPPSKSSYHLSSGSLTLINSNTGSRSAPFTTYSLEYYDRGDYDRIEYYGELDNQSPILIKMFNYEDVNSAPYYMVSSIAYQIKNEKSGSKDVALAQYDIQIKTDRLESITETRFENGGQVSKTKSFKYHDTFPTLTSQVDVDNSRGYSSRTFYSYPVDITSSTKHNLSVLGEMSSKKMHGVVVQSESQTKFPGSTDYVTSQASIIRYKIEHGLIVPHKQYTLMKTPVDTWMESDLQEVGEFMDYSSDGLLLSKKGFDEIITNYEYDAYGFLERTVVNPGTTYERATSYANKPLVGVTQVTDANARKVSYEYDDRNRLLLTRDNDGNITSRYRYHTITDNNELNAEIAVQYHVDGNYEDKSHQFSLTNINCPYGECTYTWNWGDGTSSSTGATASHTYSNGGSYTVKVTISNPEYNEPVVISKIVTIQTLVYWSLSMSGPTQHCIYDGSPSAFYANIGNGVSTCSPGGNYVYEWSYQYNSTGDFIPFGSGQPSENWPQNSNVTGTHKVRVKVTDRCNRSLTVTETFELIDSGNNCSSGGSGGPN